MRRLIGLSVAVWLVSACSGGSSAPVEAVAAPGAHGAVNPNVTQANIGSTICVSGWTATIRPPVSYTNKLKLAQIAALPPSASHKASDYEEDHIVPLGSGGAPYNPANLALQPWDGPDGAHAKDVVEVRVQHEVCAHKITLAAARACFMADWHGCP